MAPIYVYAARAFFIAYSTLAPRLIGTFRAGAMVHTRHVGVLHAEGIDANSAEPDSGQAFCYLASKWSLLI